MIKNSSFTLKHKFFYSLSSTTCPYPHHEMLSTLAFSLLLFSSCLLPGSPTSLASSKKTIARSGASGSNCLVYTRGVRGAWRGAQEAVECLARQMGEAWGRSEKEVRKGRSSWSKKFRALCKNTVLQEPYTWRLQQHSAGDHIGRAGNQAFVNSNQLLLVLEAIRW